MKILIASNIHWWNAEAAYACAISKLLQDTGHTVFVLSCPGSLNEKILKENGLNLVRIWYVHNVNMHIRYIKKINFQYYIIKKL